MPKTVRPNFRIPLSGKPQLNYWGGWSRSYVYVIRAGDDYPIKVGKANNVLGRMAELQTGNARKLILLHVLPGGLELERELHRRMDRDDRMTGEWFCGPSVAPFLMLVDKLAAEMVAWHKNTKRVPSFKQFSPWIDEEERRLNPPPDWTDQFHAAKASSPTGTIGRLSTANPKLPRAEIDDVATRRFRAPQEEPSWVPHRKSA